jgi:hypothetical protein
MRVMHFHSVAPTTESVVKKTYLSLVIIVCRNNEEKQISWTSAWKGVVMEQIVDIKIQNDDESAQRVRPIYTWNTTLRASIVVLGFGRVIEQQASKKAVIHSEINYFSGFWPAP